MNENKPGFLGLPANSGMGLLDVMLALAVSAVLFILGVNYYQNIIQEQKINQTIARIRGVTTAVSKVVAQGTTKQTIPTNMNNMAANVQNLVAPSTLVSPWDRNKMTLSAKLNLITYQNAQTHQNIQCLAYSMTVSGVPKAAQPILANKFAFAFPNSPVPTPAAAMTFQVCIE